MAQRTAPRTEQPQLKGDVSIDFHVAILEPSQNLINGFWFEDTADMLCGLRRKLGITSTEGLVERINELGIDVVQAACDPTDRTKLVVAADVDDLAAQMRLLSGISTLEDWTIATRMMGGEKRTVILGTMSKPADGRFAEGSFVQTSMLREVPKYIEEGDIVTTLNSRYHLGRRATSIPPRHAEYAGFVDLKIANPEG